MPTAEQGVLRLQRLMGAAVLLLVGSTWRLWTPQTEFPQIPWFEWACGLPGAVDWIALSTMVASCFSLLLAGFRARRIGLWLFAASLIVLLLPSQQRLQPWAWEFLLIAVTLGLAPPTHALRLIRWFVASIYIHSALSKCDVTFFDAQGELLLGGLLNAFGLNDLLWTATARRIALGLFPAGELVIGLGLLVPAVRRWALVGSYVMHAVLLLTLGPLGLGHKPGVLIWNVYFIGQNRLLFRRVMDETDADEDSGSDPLEHHLRRRIATAVIATAILCPLLQNVGCFDVWPSWAVYSARPSLVSVFVSDKRIDELPPTLQVFAGPAEALTNWHPVNLDAWSFATLNCPVYPEERFRMAVILALAEQAALADDVRVVVNGPPNRWTGQRETVEITGSEALRRYSVRYRLNTRQRHHRF